MIRPQLHKFSRPSVNTTLLFVYRSPIYYYKTCDKYIKNMQPNIHQIFNALIITFAPFTESNWLTAAWSSSKLGDHSFNFKLMALLYFFINTSKVYDFCRTLELTLCHSPSHCKLRACLFQSYCLLFCCME